MNETPSAERAAGENAGSETSPASYLYLPLAAHRIEDEVSLIEYWRAIRARKWLVLGIASAVAVLVAVVFLVIKDPVYEAEIHLLHNDTGVSSSSKSSGDRESVQSTDSGTTTSVAGTQEEALAILQSRRFTTAFIEDNNLMPILYSSKWDAKRKAWKGKPPTLWDAYDKFNRKIRYLETDSSGIEIMTIDWKDPKLAADWANSQISRLNDYLRKRDIERARKTLEYLSNEIAKTNVTELQDSLYGLVEQYQKIIATANVTEEYAFTLIDPAVAPGEEYWTKVKVIAVVIFAFVTALFLAALLALFLGYLDKQRARISQ